MEFELKDITDRLQAQFSANKRLVFWEDPSGTYEEAIADIELEDAELLNVASCELAAKRTILRDRKHDRFVVYRPGETPREQDDFLYDIKLAAVPFTCDMEGMWADECGIPMKLRGMLSDHARFFNSKDRKTRLAKTPLPKDREEDVRFAMLAVCAKADSDDHRASARAIIEKLLAESVEDKQPLMQQISECGLTSTLWATVSKLLGYQVSEGESPSMEDLAYQMLLTQCAPVLKGNQQVLSADAKRILDDLAKSPRTREAYEQIERDNSQAICDQLEPSCKNAQALKDMDALKRFDEIILLGFADELEVGSLPSKQIEQAISARRFSIWFDAFKSHYACIQAASLFLEAKSLYKSSVSALTTAKDVFDAYCSKYFEIDAQYRHFFAAYDKLPNGKFKIRLSGIKQRVCAEYDDYLVTLTDKWQLYLCEEDGAYPPKSVFAQKDFFKKEVEISFPRSQKGKRVGVIISDALRYEVGVELTNRVAHSKFASLRGKVKASVEGALSMLPSYTQLGMAALLPDGPMEIDPNTDNVKKSGSPTQGSSNREKMISSRIAGAVVLKASDVLGDGIGDVSDSPLLFVYHNAIDKRGDSRDTEGQVFAACEEAFSEIEALASELAKAGCGKVFVTADHGFLYQDQGLESHQFAEIPNLGAISKVVDAETTYSRRYIVSKLPIEDDMLIEYAALDLSLDGDYRIILPKGITRLRLRGSGARYVHGGASLQENVIPVITIEILKTGQGSHQTGVQGFSTGRSTITGSSVTLQVYQTESCSEKVSPLKVKVGVYSPDNSGKLLSTTEKTIELTSESSNAEDRKTLITLDVTNDIDDYASAIVRISRQVNNTNQYASAWEEEYSVSRAFGNDFDF